jgi:hypothetical protein
LTSLSGFPSFCSSPFSSFSVFISHFFAPFPLSFQLFHIKRKTRVTDATFETDATDVADATDAADVADATDAADAADVADATDAADVADATDAADVAEVSRQP